MATLHAWVRPLGFDPLVDHTWVTDYPTPTPPYGKIGDVAAGSHYWYCWGTYHPKGQSKKHPGGNIGTQTGDLAIAKCICTPMITSKGNPSAQGTIRRYGIDGVCHQIANQVLFATGVGGLEPLTVKQARGYKTSAWLYGTYGIDEEEWTALSTHCAVRAFGRMLMRDDFFDDLPNSLDARKTEELRALRRSFQAEVSRFRGLQGSEGASQINKLIHAYLHRAEGILTPGEYELVFGHLPQDKPRLVDPDML